MSSHSYADPVANFQIDLEERGSACVMVPVERHDEAACATVTNARPESFARVATADVAVVAAEIVRADGWTYAVDVFREKHPGLHEVDLRGAERNADSFVAGVAGKAGATFVREGAVELQRFDGVQVVRFEATGEPPIGVRPGQVDHTVVAIVVAEDCAYTLHIVGPSTRAGELREIADASLRTLHASPARGSPAFRGGITAVRVAAVVFLACVIFAAVLFARRSRRRRVP